MHSNDNPQQQCSSTLPIEIFSVPMRTMIEARQTNIHQRTQQIMKFTNTIDDNVFF